MISGLVPSTRDQARQFLYINTLSRAMSVYSEARSGFLDAMAVGPIGASYTTSAAMISARCIHVSMISWSSGGNSTGKADFSILGWRHCSLNNQWDFVANFKSDSLRSAIGYILSD